MKLFIKLIIGLVILSGLAFLLSTDEQQAAMKRRVLTLLSSDNTVPITIKNIPPVVKSGHSVSCRKTPSKTIDNRYVVYEWFDENGHKQISDKPPRRDYTKLHIKNLHVDNFFKLSMNTSQAVMPAFTKDRVDSGVKKVYKTLANVIKVAEIRNIQLSLRFISDKQVFHAYRQKVAPDTASNTTGFYTSRLNEATIWAVGNKAHITRISLHESTHAIIAAMFGGAPVWLNEGLASFFEKIEITANDVYAYNIINEHLSALKSMRLPPLAAHFKQLPKQWYANSSKNYAIDWSIVFYMMSSKEGRDLLRYMLDHLVANDCSHFNTQQFINQRFRGGLQRFELGWHQWVANARINTRVTIHGY